MTKIIDAYHKIIGEYDNGNYHVLLYDDGTKLRKTKDDEFHPLFPESIDMNITYECDGRCPYCYTSSSDKGKHCDFNKYEKLLDGIKPYTELAINGNDLRHPGLYTFLCKMKEKNVIVNMTINQRHFEKHIGVLTHWAEKGLIHGLGISLFNSTFQFIQKVKTFDNAVIHIVNGIIPLTLIEDLRFNNLKILILGYKEIGKGHEYYARSKGLVEGFSLRLKTHLPQIIEGFQVVSFDNLALKQLDVPNIIPKEEYDKIYMGDDGEFSFYIDLVNGTYSSSSLDIEDESKTFSIQDSDTIESMFETIRGIRK